MKIKKSKESVIMSVSDKKALSEMDIRTKYITPAIVKAGWGPYYTTTRGIQCY